MKRMYFDNAASTPLDPEVQTAMDVASGLTGNPSALHEEGRQARAVIDDARDAVADLLRVDAGEIVFTSGATEANWLGIMGYMSAVRRAHPDVRLHVLTTPLEHASVKAVMSRLTEEGVDVEVLPVDEYGCVTADVVLSAVREETVLVAVMWVNNLFGAMQPIPEIGEMITRVRKGREADAVLPIVLFSDAVQAVGTQDVFPDASNVDLLTISGHKIFGPKGVGVLFVRDTIPFTPVAGGGGQERGRRAGTENVAAIAGIGEATRILVDVRTDEAIRLTSLRDRLVAGLADVRGFARVLGDRRHIAPHIVYVLFRKDADTMVVSLDVEGVAVSSGSACDTGTRKTDDVLRTVCSDREATHGGVRFSFGRFTSEGEVDALLAILDKIGSRN
ncbi:cysteine desulfurase family protein [Patescibacteria group bacterium]